MGAEYCRTFIAWVGIMLNKWMKLYVMESETKNAQTCYQDVTVAHRKTVVVTLRYHRNTRFLYNIKILMKLYIFLYEERTRPRNVLNSHIICTPLAVKQIVI